MCACRMTSNKEIPLNSTVCISAWYMQYIRLSHEERGLTCNTKNTPAEIANTLAGVNGFCRGRAKIDHVTLYHGNLS